MKRTVKTVEKHTYIIEEFSNFNELIRTNDGRQRNFTDGEGGRNEGNNGWCGASYDEAVEMLTHGWDDKEKLDKFKETVSTLNKMHEVQKMSFKNDIVGYAPIVPLAIMGVPQNMINSTRKPKKAKIVTIIMDIGLASSVKASEKLEWGAKVTSAIVNLEKQGFRVKIECVKTFCEDRWSGKIHVCKVPIKSENQPFDLRRMMFPIAHPAMNRRIMFDWYERLPEAERIGGYGCSLQYHSDRHAKAVKAVIADTENSYYISIKDDINDVLKGVA